MTVGGGIEVGDGIMSTMNRTLLICTGVLLLFGCGAGSQSRSPGSDPPANGEVVENLQMILQDIQLNSEPEPMENLEGVLLVIETLSDEEKEDFLSGVWDLFFPTPAGNWGHRFRDNYVYRYVDLSPEAKEQRYWYTDGVWRIAGNEIQVKLTSYRMSDRDAVEMPFGLGYPPDTEYITVLVEDDAWHTIGTMESIRTGIVRDGWEFPPRITLRPLRFDRVLDEEYHYYRDRL